MISSDGKVITLNLSELKADRIAWMENNLPRLGVPMLHGVCHPSWLRVVAANLYAFIGSEWVEQPEINSLAVTITFKRKNVTPNEDSALRIYDLVWNYIKYRTIPPWDKEYSR